MFVYNKQKEQSTELFLYWLIRSLFQLVELNK